MTLNGSDITFTNPKHPQDHFNGTYDKASDHLFLSELDSYSPSPLSRRDRGDVLGFYARIPDIAKYTYTQPIAGDGWPTASLADVGISEKPIAALIEKILTADPTDNPVNIDSLLIARHGKLVLEEYFHGFDKERPHDMRSASKSFAPILAGIARDHGFRPAPTRPLIRSSRRTSHSPAGTHTRAM